MTFQFSPQQQDAAQRLYDQAYQIGGTNFANLALGTASTEGLTPTTANVPNIWGNTGDHGLSYGPLQLYTGGGIGNQLGGDLSPDNQLNVGLNTMYNGGNYNLQPWNGPANFFGGSAGQGNLFQTQTMSFGAQQAQFNGITPGGQTEQDLPQTSQIGPVDQPTTIGSDSQEQFGSMGVDTSPSLGFSSDAGMTPSSSTAISGSMFDQGSGSGLPGPVDAMGLGGSGSSPADSLSPIGDNSSAQFAQVMNISGATAPTAAGSDSGSGVPVDITDPTTIASKAGGDVKQGAEQLGTKIQGTGAKLDAALGSDTASAEKTGTGWLQTIVNTVSNLASSFLAKSHLKIDEAKFDIYNLTFTI